MATSRLEEHIRQLSKAPLKPKQRLLILRLVFYLHSNFSAVVEQLHSSMVINKRDDAVLSIECYIYIVTIQGSRGAGSVSQDGSGEVLNHLNRMVRSAAHRWLHLPHDVNRRCSMHTLLMAALDFWNYWYWSHSRDVQESKSFLTVVRGNVTQC